MVYPWNLFILYFGASTLAKKALSIQNNGHLGWVYFLLCSAPFHEPRSPVLTFAFKHLQPAFFESLKVDLERSIDHLRFPADFWSENLREVGWGWGKGTYCEWKQEKMMEKCINPTLSSKPAIFWHTQDFFHRWCSGLAAAKHASFCSSLRPQAHSSFHSDWRPHSQVFCT